VTTEPWPDPNGFCDTTTNVAALERPLTFMHLVPNKWGYFPGHNEPQLKYYAEKYENYTYTHVSGMLVPVVKAYNLSGTGKVRFTVWDMDSVGKPWNVLGYKDVSISDFTPYLFHPVHFNSAIPVNGKFFIGYQLYYNTSGIVDTFVVYMAPNRGPVGENTLFVKKGSQWLTPTQFFNDTLVVNTSLGIKLLGCLESVGSINFETQMSVYPNPASTIVNVDLFDINVDEYKFAAFDLVGRKIDIEASEASNGKYELDFSRVPEGIYVLDILVNKERTTRKITIIR
jgi:hypothetical protein